MTQPLSPLVAQYRHPEYAVHPLFVERWSPRSFTGEAMPNDDLMAIFEAAKWAPSSFNNQPWRFIYAPRTNTVAWEKLFKLLGEFNQGWVNNAAVLMLVISKKTFEHNGKPSRTHNFDAGTAWGYLALAAHLRGWAAHGMEGFDYDAARVAFNLSADYDVEAMVALGKPAAKEKLAPELQEREFPSDRKKLNELFFEGKFSA